MYSNTFSILSKGFFIKTASTQKSPLSQKNNNIPPGRLNWSATFIGYDHLGDNFFYRRLNFKNLRSSKGEIIKSSFSIDESEGLQAIGNLTYGEIVSFTTDHDFKDIIFCYPHGKPVE